MEKEQPVAKESSAGSGSGSGGRRAGSGSAGPGSGASIEYTYDQDGKIVFVKKPLKNRFAPQNIRTRIVQIDENGNAVPVGENGQSMLRASAAASKPRKQQPAGKSGNPRSEAAANTAAEKTSAEGPQPAAPTTVDFTADTNLDNPNTLEAIRLHPNVSYREADQTRHGPAAQRTDLLEYGKSFTLAPGATLYSNYVKSLPNSPTKEAKDLPSATIISMQARGRILSVNPDEVIEHVVSAAREPVLRKITMALKPVSD